MSTAEQSTSLVNPYGDDHKWPNNLYEEMTAMSAVSFFVYYFSLITEVGRRTNKEIQGLKVANNDPQTSYTPAEVKAMIQNNQEELAKHYKAYFGLESTFLRSFYTMLDQMQERADAYTAANARTDNSSQSILTNDAIGTVDESLQGQDVVDDDEQQEHGDAKSTKEYESSGTKPFEPLTLETFDDQYQNKELVYGLTRDSINKRITIVFRGTDARLALFSNWFSNINVRLVKADVPECLKGVNGLRIHRGFYSYLFMKTIDDTDAESTTKFDQIMTDIKKVLKDYPDHKVYVTGHSLGAALATLAGFYMSCDPDLPKPISSISFASPRVGNASFFNCVQHQERTRQLRIIRVVNDNDTIAVVPTLAYKHVGFQCTLYKNPKHRPIVHYPSKDLTCTNKTKIVMRNSVFSSFNFGYDHSQREFDKRISHGKSVLEGLNLNTLYCIPAIVGFELEGRDDPPTLEVFLDNNL